MPKVIVKDSDKQRTAAGLDVGTVLVDDDGKVLIVTDGGYVVCLSDGNAWDWSIVYVRRILNNPTITITEE